MGSYIRPLLFGWQYFILYEKHCFCIPELRWWESRLLLNSLLNIVGYHTQQFDATSATEYVVVRSSVFAFVIRRFNIYCMGVTPL